MNALCCTNYLLFVTLAPLYSVCLGLLGHWSPTDEDAREDQVKIPIVQTRTALSIRTSVTEL